MASEEERAQVDPSPSETTGYPYQPQLPTYYPVRHEQESSSSAASLSRGIQNQSILRCRGPCEGDSKNNLYRWAKWCSDGSAALAQAEDRSIHVLEVPQEILNLDTSESQADDQAVAAEDRQREEEPCVWTPSLISRHPTPITSAAWYPSASRNNPATYCFVVGTRDRPIRLIDAYDGRNRGSYSILHNEQFMAPTCMTFNNDATRLYAGHDGAIDVFDISQPGEGERIKLSPSRKSKEGQKGLVSAIAFSPDTSSGLFAVGTFKGGRVSCYSDDTGEERVMELDLGSGGDKVDGQGITQLAFHPLNPYVVFSASRQSDYISVYDIRNPAYGPYLCLHRPGMTQQRLGFDIDWAGRYLSTGGTDGTLRVYDINPPINDKPVMEYNLHTCAIGSVSTHPFKPWILTAYGSRQPSSFERSLEDSSDGEVESDSSEESEESEESDSDSDSDDDVSTSDVESSNTDVEAAVLLQQPVDPATNASRPTSPDEPSGQPRDPPVAIPRNQPPVSARQTNHAWIGAINVSTFS